MGQAKSYNEQFISKELANIERELIAYKATQDYGATQIQNRIIPLFATISPKPFDVYGTTNYWVLIKVKFSGVNKNKLARGALNWSAQGTIYAWELLESSETEKKSEMSWYLLVRGASGFSLSVSAYMNMNGTLSYEWEI